MKSTGIVRPVDGLGRIVLPMELRRTLDIHIKDPMEIFVDGRNIILRPYRLRCMCCGKDDTGDLIREKDGVVCPKCVAALATRIGGDAT